MDHIRGAIAFVAAARVGSFTRAARSLDLSPQAVAASIARLEESLGVRLFNRTTRSIALTEEGSVFLQHAQMGLATLDDAVQALRDRTGAPSGLVRVTTGAAFARRYLLRLLPEFSKRYPDVRLDLSFDDRKVDIVREGLRRGHSRRRDCRFVADHTARLCAAYDLRGEPGVSAQARRAEATRRSGEASHHCAALRIGATSTWDFQVKGKGGAVRTGATGADALRHRGGRRCRCCGHRRCARCGALCLALSRQRQAQISAWSLQRSRRREMVIHHPHREFVAPRIRAFVDFALDTLQHEVSLHVTPKDLQQYEA